MDVPAEVDAEPEQANPFSFKKKIAFKDVEFAYNGHPVLRHFDLEIEKGKTYALVGASGCGKSTVVDLLCRFYQPQKGEIAIDDAPCRAFGLGKYRDRIGLVSQEAQLFRDSVLENIRYGRLDSSKEEIERAAEELAIEEPEDALETVCDSKANLSGGQKQRIAASEGRAEKSRNHRAGRGDFSLGLGERGEAVAPAPRAKPTTRRSSSSATGSAPSGRSMRLSAWTREKLSRKAPMPN